jgi:hypothetical protein
MTPNKLYDSPTTDGIILPTRIADPFDEDFEPQIMEVLMSLPIINRYNGHTSFPYSVAHHSLLVAEIAKYKYGYDKPHAQLMFLLHDAAEAYLQDLIRPLKRFSTNAYLEAEERITRKLFNAMLSKGQALDWQLPRFQHVVKEIDTRLALTEILFFFPEHEDPLPGWEPYDIEILFDSYHDIRIELITKVQALLEALR